MTLFQSTTDESNDSASLKEATAAGKPSAAGPADRTVHTSEWVKSTGSVPPSLVGVDLPTDSPGSNYRDASPVTAPSEPSVPEPTSTPIKTEAESNAPQSSSYPPRPASYQQSPPPPPPPSSYQSGTNFSGSSSSASSQSPGGCRSLEDMYKFDPITFSDAINHIHEQVLLGDPTNEPEHSQHLEMLGDMLHMRFEQEGNQYDLDGAIEQHREALACRAPGHPKRGVSLADLARVLMSRYENMGDEEARSEAYRYAQEASILCGAGAGGGQTSPGFGGATGFGGGGASPSAGGGFGSMGGGGSFSSFNGANGFNLGGAGGRYTGGGSSYQGASVSSSVFKHEGAAL